MAIPVRVRLPSSEPEWSIEITDDASRTLVRTVDANISYHSRCGAAAECDHVYLENGGFDHDSTVDATLSWPTVVLEIGFGTGLSMLRTLDRVVQFDRPLRYVSIERAPLRAETLRELDLGRGLQQPDLAARFLDWYSEISGVKSRCEPASKTWQWRVSQRQQVELVVGDVRDWITRASLIVDAIYFDPFDPKTNPELWERSFLRQLVERLAPGGRLVTYCVASEIRRRMQSVGLSVQRVPGPTGGKREVMLATRVE